MRSAEYEKGDLIITEGQRGADAFAIERGWVEVFRAGPPELPLAVLGPGDIFGEMALITEQPRSASVRALEAVWVGIVDRDEFLDHLRADPDALLPFLRTLSERIRNMTTLVEELARRSPAMRPVIRAHLGIDPPVAAGLGQAPAEARLRIEGLTPGAIEAVGGRALLIDRFPFRIGRQTREDDPFSLNELAIPDGEAAWVSRNHCMLTYVEGHAYLIDRGSRLGTLVDGQMVGGQKQAGWVELTDGEHEVRIGGALTPLRFLFTVARKDGPQLGKRARGRKPGEP